MVLRKLDSILSKLFCLTVQLGVCLVYYLLSLAHIAQYIRNGLGACSVAAARQDRQGQNASEDDGQKFLCHFHVVSSHMMIK